MNLVRKFLQEDDQPMVDGSLSAEIKKKTKKRRRQRRENDEDNIATEQDVMQATVDGMVYLDRVMAKYSDRSYSKNGAMKRRKEESKKAKKRRKQNLENDIMMGNSRSSSSQVRLPSEPSFNKKKHKKELEEKRLREIAKLFLSKKKKASKMDLEWRIRMKKCEFLQRVARWFDDFLLSYNFS